MNDCYHILGVSRYSTMGEIRAAFLSRMKVCHPDSGRIDLSEEAAQISQAYWQLRDAHRRSDHDRLVFGPLKPTPPQENPRRMSLAKRQLKKSRHKAPVRSRSARHRPKNKRLDPLRTWAGVAACSLAIAAFSLAGTNFVSSATPQVQTAVPASTSVRTGAAAKPLSRRQIDAQLTESATDEFRVIVARSGLAGAHLYARQCLMELTARPTMAMLDFCMAFDDQASAWEDKQRGREQASRRYFAADQRFGRYASIARQLAPGPVRATMMVDVSFFAAARE